MADAAGAGVPRISFAIPYYDNPGYLAEAISSVRAQVVSDWELVVVDDAGPEPAADLVGSLADPRVRYHRNATRLGLPGNWNECLRQCRAPLATLLHGDDRLLPSYAEEVLRAADEHPEAAAVFTRATIIGEDGAPARTVVDLAKSLLSRGRDLGELRGDAGLAVLLAGNVIYCPTLAVRRAVVGPDPFDERWRFLADWDFTVRQLLEGRALVGIGHPLLEYRRHRAQTTVQLSRDTVRFEEELTFLRLMSTEAECRGFTRGARAARRRVATRAHLSLNAGTDLAHGRVALAGAKGRMLWRDLVSGQ
ncbi:MAG TPA: glycosyltransferase [Nocardioides sp.]|jgi:glycosyl transferase family 2|nr:glycosyltransferase [Nocardioides sp.]